MVENSILRVEFEGVRGVTMDNLVSTIRSMGYVVRETTEQPKNASYIRYETTMDRDTLDRVIIDTGSQNVIKYKLSLE